MTQILVVADFEDNKTIAIKQAINMAGAYNAKLHIVYFCYESLRGVQGDREAVKAQVVAKQATIADQQLANIDFAGVDYSHDVIWEKHIAKWLEDYASNNNPALVLKTGHRTETFFYTPTDWQLLRDCSAPLMIVAEEKWRKKANVLAAVDLQTQSSEKLALNEQVLTQATHLAKHIGGQVYVSYTVPLSPVLKDLGLQFSDEAINEANRTLSGKIADLAAKYDIPTENFDINAGQPEKVIPSMAAKHKAGLVVVGTVGRKGLVGKLVGNTAEKIFKLLKTDVLAIKP